MYKEAIEAWDPVAVSVELPEARLQAHWALQAVAAVGAAAVPARTDDSHTSARWLPRHEALMGEATAGGHHAALRLGDLTALVLDDHGNEVARRSLHGGNLQDTLQWFAATLQHAGEGELGALALPAYEMPAHPVGRGENFHASAALEDLARWFSNASGFLQAVQRGTSGASAVRCWPHHFDMATLITLDADESDPEKARSIGVGLSPGDRSYEQPYFYVNPWPPPRPGDLPPLDGPGQWHCESWVGALLVAARVACVPGQEQAAYVAHYLDTALAACEGLLGE